MQLDDPRLASHAQGPVPLWLLLAVTGVILGSAALVAALSGSGAELAGAHVVLRKVCLL